MSRHRIIALLFTATMLLGTPLRAEVDAQVVFTEARDLYQDKQFDAALAGFEKALATSGSPNARLYLARCLRELGRVAEAYEQLSTTRTEAASRAQEEPHYATTRDVATEELRQLEPRIAKLIVTVPASVTGVSVTIDGSVINEARLGEALPLEPGQHELVATAPDREPVRSTLVLTAGRTKNVPLFITGPGPAGPDPDKGPSSDSDGDASLRTTSFVVGGIGIAGIAAGAVFGAVALAKKGDVEDNCDGLACNAQGAKAAEDGNLFGNISTVGFVVGGVALATGLTLLLLSGDDDDEARAWSQRRHAHWHPAQPLTITW
ncbi:MAG: hypothetical protein DRI90_12110 [Deltaproteobacteria bacterium]|nr:MAG: hypothetical protein DRI90_12110 [Deltaproteobacteria bacterium]